MLFRSNPTLDASNGYIQKLSANSLRTYPRKLKVGITTITNTTTIGILTTGRKVSESSKTYNYGYIVGTGCSVYSVGITTGGTNYTTQSNVSTYPITGQGSGLTVNITPTSSSNKIFVMVNGIGGSVTYTHLVALRLVRNGTGICVGNATSGYYSSSVGGLRGSLDANSSWPFSISHLDSPATTSAVSYGLQGFIEINSGWCINRNGTDTGSAIYSYRGATTITAMEIVG